MKSGRYRCGFGLHQDCTKSGIPWWPKDGYEGSRCAVRVVIRGATICVAENSLHHSEVNSPLDELRRNWLRLKPDYAEAHNNLGSALASAGHTSEAIAQFEEVLRLKLSPGAVYRKRSLN